MEYTEVTLILLDILLVLVIICMYARVNNILSLQQRKITSLAKEKYSLAYLQTRAAKYAGQNELMPSNGQVKKPEKVPAMATNTRGDFNVNYLPNLTRVRKSEDEQKAAAGALSVVSVDEKTAQPDDSALPVIRPTGVIEINDNTTPTALTNNRNDPELPKQLINPVGNTTNSGVTQEGFRIRRTAL